MAASTPDVDRFVGRFTKWTNAVLVSSLLATVTFVMWPGLAGAGGSSSPASAPAYVAGTRIDTPAAWHEASPYTLVLFAQASCGACQRAQPFLRQLVARFADRAPVVYVTPGANRDDEFAFGQSLGLPDATIRWAPVDIRARVTPTLVLVDRTGTILHAWEGVPPADQPAIVETIETAIIPG
jgi:thiol-disulfide isomerase/thioredoxin